MKMNLISDPWIPAVTLKGKQELHSLDSLFSQAHSLRDLALKPHERIAVMRLLICIVQASLDGPADEEEWSECLPRIQPQTSAYLKRWAGSFELFGEGDRFLQLNNLKSVKATDDGTPTTKLDLSLATGNNSVLFDNCAGESRKVEPARAAINLLTFQCFSPGGLIGVASWNGAASPGDGKSTHAPCTPSSMLHTIVVGSTLLATIHSNLLTKEIVGDNYLKSWGAPIWEMPVRTISDKGPITNATLNYLGRLVPISRAIRLEESGYAMVLANALEYPILPHYREATATVILRKEGLGLLPAATGRGVWRQLHAITVKRVAGTSSSAGPLALTHNFNTPHIELWIGALVTDKAKIEDVIEAGYTVPSILLSEAGHVAYELGVKFAEEQESALMKAVGSYHHCLKNEQIPYDRARAQYWTLVEQHLAALFSAAEALISSDQLPSSMWGRAAADAARDAYEQSCPRRTSRQVQAYAQGIRLLSRAATHNISKTKKNSTHE